MNNKLGQLRELIREKTS